MSEQPLVRRSPSLTEHQKAIANMLIKKFKNLCLLSGFYRDQPVAFVCRVKRAAGQFVLAPLFVVVDPAMWDNCRDCDGRPLSGGKGKGK